MALLIAKSDGTQEPFNPEKLVASLVRAGAEHGLAREITAAIEKELYSGITTQEIYRHAFARLRQVRRGTAARYSLKRALLDLGPSGFPFEAYLAEIFRAEGAEAKIDQIIQGTCVEHEVDVVMHKEGIATFVEAKFHNAAGFKTDLKVVLYVKARLDDIVQARRAKGQEEPMRGLIATNTKFTSVAAQYAACAGVELLSWEEPRGSTLEERIEATGLYPITALTSLGRREKMALLERKIVLCKTIMTEPQTLASVGLSGAKAAQVTEEIEALCASRKDIK